MLSSLPKLRKALGFDPATLTCIVAVHCMIVLFGTPVCCSPATSYSQDTLYCKVPLPIGNVKIN